LAPRMAASVNTRVVSLNDATEMNDWVVRLALVMPDVADYDVRPVLRLDSPVTVARGALPRKADEATGGGATPG
jgi:hypothetical protein